MNSNREMVGYGTVNWEYIESTESFLKTWMRRFAPMLLTLDFRWVNRAVISQIGLRKTLGIIGVIWLEGKPYPLESVIVNLDGWSLAPMNTQINERGQIATGGLNGEKDRAILLNPVE
jgi:hypothetical protein